MRAVYNVLCYTEETTEKHETSSCGVHPFAESEAVVSKYGIAFDVWGYSAVGFIISKRSVLLFLVDGKESKLPRG